MLKISEHKFILVQILKDVYSDKEIAPMMGFKGGTACYLFYKLPRFSVDLDFNLLDKAEKDLVFSRIKNIMIKYGDLKEARIKRNTLFYLLSYGDESTNIKVEISRRDFPDHYEVLNYLGISMLVMTKADIMAHKLVALLDRSSMANRDLFDLWFFFNNRWKINQELVELRTREKLGDYLKKCEEEVKNINNIYILQGLGEVLNAKQKYWVKENLKNEILFLLRNFRESSAA
ncbi:MAG: nucleotidyl transferase AbiEii/AbiGii toxin family protein [Candidatus Aminicenantes bacterium]|nr:nucleotidyl transferase AbiEii/AbiGii toxin family protein [Candidatus Aminicenantes bacterium]